MLQNKDVMKSIRSSLYYYENVAQSLTNVERQGVIENSAAKLKNIIGHIEAELESTQKTHRVNRPLRQFLAITTKIERLKKGTSNLFSTKEFQQKKVVC